ncbi:MULTISPECIES: CDP-alcohol phosphatidyltransferase family protein [Methanothrix]|jgi:phosphatidylglycerophosphate synthase|uniref:CDP-alcohol phosphatidyltransferase n=4 Tax=root TaxID=1 RepID=F4BXZ0_METSG|nr:MULTISPECIES: CDP-alcohol phosphatidyltransferase family protein [Methanothrix]AEB67574.1 CDP-alcohol phosphatidyltransferase [Methanothrix soehngenii GP6]MBP7068223.1 CDP-alcohol phosphatidyltransferase family protein [Methanothrix sp.]MDD3551273.1 CDP-alcohol phosphatidyltransferase family protein [Methanothrix soehngenii]MDY0411997.1 CDP-alcohol phosphatidyltransferase family protein [Methanothrix soehngenii]NLJ23257.1 CDP-alcohol phosphatidyltransferase family protein [Methanothrix soeh
MLKATLRSEKTDRLAGGLAAIGLSPNAWTLISLVPALAGLVALVMHQLALGLAMFALSAFIDIVDGTVARVTNQVSDKGAYIDGVVDRYVELMLYLGLLIYIGRGEFFGLPNEVWIVLLIFGGLMTSFVRAYADHRGIVKDPGELKRMGGLLERLERLMLLYFGMFLGLFDIQWLMAVIALTALLANATALQRIRFALRAKS